MESESWKAKGWFGGGRMTCIGDRGSGEGNELGRGNGDKWYDGDRFWRLRVQYTMYFFWGGKG